MIKHIGGLASGHAHTRREVTSAYGGNPHALSRPHAQGGHS